MLRLLPVSKQRIYTKSHTGWLSTFHLPVIIEQHVCIAVDVRMHTRTRPLPLFPQPPGGRCLCCPCASASHARPSAVVYAWQTTHQRTTPWARTYCAANAQAWYVFLIARKHAGQGGREVTEACAGQPPQMLEWQSKEAASRVVRRSHLVCMQACLHVQGGTVTVPAHATGAGYTPATALNTISSSMSAKRPDAWVCR